MGSLDVQTEERPCEGSACSSALRTHGQRRSLVKAGVQWPAGAPVCMASGFRTNPT
jgi:hypothetical protein